ncbi:tyrosine-protein phosphatase [Acidobacteriota bacterium]
MIDLHTHLLPDWDDGAEDWDEMFKMAEIAHQDGIEKVVLTPHVGRLTKYENDLSILDERMLQFRLRCGGIPLEFTRGAEVLVDFRIIKRIWENKLAINGTNYVFVEFPIDQIDPGVNDLFYRMMLDGLIPIISHPERNEVFVERPDLLYELVKLGSRAMVTALSITGDFGSETKKTAQLFLMNNLVHVIASDAHDAKNWSPRLNDAVEKARKIVGEEKAEAMVTTIPQAILDNKAIPDYGEPQNPVKKRWRGKLR